MRLTTKGRFAVVAMLDLGIHAPAGPVNLASISERQGISLSYLEQLFGKLRRKNLVSSHRGPGGGYSLNKAAEAITILDIIAAVDDDLDATQCGGKANCLGEKPCMTHELWENLNLTIINYLSSINLAKLITQQNAMHAPHQQTQIVHLMATSH